MPVSVSAANTTKIEETAEIVAVLHDICRVYGYRVSVFGGVYVAIAWTDDAVSFRELASMIAHCTSWQLSPAVAHHPLGRLEVSYLVRATHTHVHLHICPGIRH